MNIKTETVIKGDLLVESKDWIAYDRTVFKDTLVMWDLRTLIKEGYNWSYEELLGNIRKYLKNTTVRSKVDLYVDENSIKICKPRKTLPIIWILKKK